MNLMELFPSHHSGDSLMPGHEYRDAWIRIRQPDRECPSPPHELPILALKEAPPAGGPVAMACIDIIMQQPASDTDQE